MLTYKCDDPSCSSKRADWKMVNGKLIITCSKCERVDSSCLR